MRAPCGSGGVGFLLRRDVTDPYNVRVLDTDTAGILWLQLAEKAKGQKINICVCYIPPSRSTRNVDAEQFFNNLLTKIYMYQNEGIFYICGDFNSRCANKTDYIEGVDDLPERAVVDFKDNAYGDVFINFLVNGNCCILNGRNHVNNDFTCISIRGKSVVDYCVIPYETLGLFSDFQVIRATDLFNQASCVCIVDPTGAVISDHSLLRWRLNLPRSSEDAQLNSSDQQTTQERVQYQVKVIPIDFMKDTHMDMALECLLNEKDDQHAIDAAYGAFCDTVRSEMEAKLPRKKCALLATGTVNKRRRVGKPWWNESLTVLWNGMCTAEKAWHRTNGKDKHKLRADFVQKRRELDKQVQRAKREYWYQQQRDLLSMNSNDPKSFWKKIGHIGVGNERKQPVPEEVIYEDGSVSKDSNDVLKKWQNDFSNLLNSNSN